MDKVGVEVEVFIHIVRHNHEVLFDLRKVLFFSVFCRRDDLCKHCRSVEEFF